MLKFDDPVVILVAALVVTSVFYLMAQISVSYFVRSIAVKMCNFPKAEHEIMLEEFAKAITNELDYRREARSILRFNENFRDSNDVHIILST